MKESTHKLIACIVSLSLVRKAIVAFAKRRPYTHIPDDGSYMERYWVIKEGGWLSNKLGIAVRVHIIKSPDRDRVRHTHPFTFRTYIMQGWYYESREGTEGEFRVAGETYLLDSKTSHQIEVIGTYEPCITLFVTGNRVGDWYFDTDEGLIPHATYLNEENENGK